MPEPSGRALELAERFELALSDRHLRGAVGERLARGSGASLEFLDRRAYAAGDDVRHLDWRTYGRTGELMVKLYREEVRPRVDLLVDASASMRAGTGKEQLAVDLCALLAIGARRGGLSVRLIALREGAVEVDLERFTSRGLELDAPAELAPALEDAASLLRAGSLRVLVSDLLAPVDAALVVGRLGGPSGASLALVQVLASEDLRPGAGEAARLIDAETGALRDLVLDGATVERYTRRLRNLCDTWRAECARRGEPFASLDAAEGLEAACRGELAASGLLIPASRPSGRG